MSLATVTAVVAPASVKAASYPQIDSSFYSSLSYPFANAGVVNLAAPPTSGPANPDPGSVTSSAGGAPLQSASILKSDLTGSQLASTTLISLGLDKLPVEIPLSTIPLTRTSAPKSWNDVLFGTALAGIPLINVTWKQVLALGASMPAVVKSLTLADVDWSGSILANLPLAALTFGGQDITTIVIPPQPNAASTSPQDEWCALLNNAQANSCPDAKALVGQSLISLGVQGAPLKNIPLKNIPLKNIDLASSPLKNIPLKNIALLIAPLKNIPLKNIDVEASPLKNIPLKNIAWATSPLKNIPLKNIDLANSPLKNIPLKNIDFTSAPLKNIPLKNIDLANSGLGAIPLKNIDFASAPLKNIPLKNIDLASTPLKNIPLKNIALAGAPLKNIPLKNIDFASAPLKNIPLKNIDLAASGLGTTPLAALNWLSSGIAAAPLTQFTLATGPLASISISALRNPANVVACAATASCPAGATLGSLAASVLPAATLADIGASAFGTLTLSDLIGALAPGASLTPTLGDLRLDLAGSGAPTVTIEALVNALVGADAPSPVLTDIDPSTMIVSPSLGDLGLGSLADTGATVSALIAATVAGSPDILLGDLGLGTLTGGPSISLAQFLGWVLPAQPAVTLGDLRLDTATGVDALLLDAVVSYLVGGALDGYLLGDLATFTDNTGHDITLGELGTWTDNAGQDITLGQLAQYLDDSVSLADVLLGLVPPSQFPFENFPISSLGLNAPGRLIVAPTTPYGGSGGGNQAALAPNQPITLTQRFLYSDPSTPALPVDVAFVLPPGASLTSATPAAGTSIAPVTDLDPTGRVRVTFPNFIQTYSTLLSFTIGFLPGLTLGDNGIDVHVYAPGTHTDVETPRTDTTTPTLDSSEPNTPQEAIAGGYSSPAGGRVPVLPTNPSGCSASDASCTGFDPVYVDALAPGYINYAGDVDWYAVTNVKAGSRITADLSNLPVSADLVIYGPAGIASSPTLFPNALQGLPGSLIQDPGLSVGQAARALAANRLNDVWLDPGYTDPFIPAPDGVHAPMTPLSISEASGTDPQGAGVVAPVNGDYVVQVSGYGTAASNDPYLLRVRVTAPTTEATCAARTFANPMPAPTSSVPTIDSSINTLILTNPSRLAATYGQTAADSVASGLTSLQAWLGSHPSLGINAAVVPIDGSPSIVADYTAWDQNPCSVSAANKVSSDITGVIAALRASAPNLQYITIAGGDDIIPMGRTPDLTRVSNETAYASTFASHPNPLSAAEAAGFTLTDDGYGDPSPTPIGNGSSLFVPKLAVGRLVETPTDITNQLAHFTSANGILDTSTALVAGYDFLADGASAVASRLSVGGRNIDSSLIDVPGATTSPWTTSQLVAKLFPSTGATPLIDSINAHYDHTALLSSAGNAGDATDVETAADIATRAGATNLVGRVLFTMGCHAGLAVPDAYVQGSDPASLQLKGDWAQVLSSAGVSVYVANTGFGIGDTSSVAYTERLMGLYARLLDGSVTAGQALAYAKQAYYGSLGAVGVYDTKILQQATFYGLPFWHLTTAPGQTPPVPAAPALPGTISTDATTGLQAMPLTVSTPTFTKVMSPTGGAYWTTGTDDPQVTQFEPIEPKITQSVVTAGQTAHGALITALVSHDVTGVIPVVNTPTADALSSTPQVRADAAAWPSKLATVTTSQAPYGRAQSLVVLPGQFIGSTYDGTGVQRLFDSVGTKVFYAPDANANFTPPTITRATGTASGSTVAFSASVTPFGSGSVKEVLVGYRDLDGSWKFVALTGGPSGYTGSGSLSRSATASDAVSFFIQAVDDSGNVGVSAGRADGLAALVADTTPPTITTSVSPAPNAAGWVKTSSATVTFTCTDSGSGIAPGACPAPQTITAPGTTVIHATTVDRAGNPAAVDTAVRVDGASPTVAANVSPAGWSNAASATVTFTCSATVSGLDASGCPAPQTVTAEGTTTVSGTATSVAGNATTTTATVLIDRTPPSITPSVTPAPNPAGWSKGTTATVHFTCADTASGVASCPADVQVGQGVTAVGGTALDVAGNSASIAITVQLDGTAPTITSQVTPAPNSSGWTNAASVTVTFTCSDALSGVGSCTAPQTVTAEGSTTVTGTAADLAGNRASVSTPVKIDRTPPVVNVVLSAVPTTASCSTADSAPSGVNLASGVAVTASLTQTTSRNADGIPMTTATCSGGTDNAGNLAPPVSKTFVAPMTFSGFITPVNNPPVVNTGNAGRTYPTKFQLQDGTGAYISSLKAVLKVTYATVACTAFSTVTDDLPTTTTTSTAGLQYDPVANQYVYTWKTPSAGGCYVLKVALLDGSSYYANFKLK